MRWLNGEIESGRLTVAERTIHKYMRIARNSPREANLLEAPSIRAALELLSDKEQSEPTSSPPRARGSTWTTCVRQAAMVCIARPVIIFRRTIRPTENPLFAVPPSRKIKIIPIIMNNLAT